MPKDTVVNIEETGEFVYNLATWNQRDVMNKTAQIVDRGIDEMAAAGIEPLPSKLVKPPRVGGSPVHFECRYHQTVVLPGNRPVSFHRVVFGLVVAVHIDDDVITRRQGRRAQDAADLAARLQGLHRRSNRSSRWTWPRPRKPSPRAASRRNSALPLSRVNPHDRDPDVARRGDRGVSQRGVRPIGAVRRRPDPHGGGVRSRRRRRSDRAHHRQQRARHHDRGREPRRRRRRHRREPGGQGAARRQDGAAAHQLARHQSDAARQGRRGRRRRSSRSPASARSSSSWWSARTCRRERCRS